MKELMKPVEKVNGKKTTLSMIAMLLGMAGELAMHFHADPDPEWLVSATNMLLAIGTGGGTIGILHKLLKGKW